MKKNTKKRFRKFFRKLTGMFGYFEDKKLSFANKAFVLISINFSAVMFAMFSEELYFKILWICVAIAIDIFKVRRLIVLKAVIKDNSYREKTYAKGYNKHLTRFVIICEWIKKWLFKVTANLAIYLFFTGLSCAAIFGSVLKNVNEQSESAQISSVNIEIQVKQLEIDAKEIQIADKQAQILGAEKTRDKLGSSIATGATKVLNSQSKFIDDKASLNKELTILKRDLLIIKATAEKEGTTKRDALDMFALIGSKIGMAGKDVLYYIMLSMVIAIELCIALTTGESSSKKERINNTTRKDLTVYIEGLFDGIKNRLNNDVKVSEITGLAIMDCRIFREKLSKMSIDGKPLIEIKRGGTMSNFRMKDIVSFVQK